MDIYRQLQRHLNRQPVGFPAARSGADLRLLEQLFSPEEAAMALHLTFRPETLEEIAVRSGIAGAETLLESMFLKGTIARKERSGAVLWSLLPLVVGIYEFQGARPPLRFLKAASEYMKTLAFARSFVSVKPSQMRTIPIEKSIPLEHHVAPYDQIRAIIQKANGPFVILPCICREHKKRQRKKCLKTERIETCLGFNELGAMVLRRKQGREIDREEALSILAKNEEDGLVLQPAGAKAPEFVCSCCGCCCGMLEFQKLLPRPADFWTSSYFAEADAARCSNCGRCVERCQTGALSLAPGGLEINLNRCIGCGLCVAACAKKALRLIPKRSNRELPENEDALNEEILKNKKSILGEWLTLAGAAFKIRL